MGNSTMFAAHLVPFGICQDKAPPPFFFIIGTV